MYIYKITNLVNNKIYIGQSKRKEIDTKEYFGSGKLINLAINKHGKENFKKEILEECKTKKELDERERHWIKYYNSTNRKTGYNISIGGDGGNLGKLVNKKISNSVKKLWKQGKYDHVNWSIHQKGKKLSEECKRKISESQKGENGYWYKREFTKKHKEKISLSGIKRFNNKEEREKFRNIMRSKEVRKKISGSLKGNVPWNKGKSDVYSKESLERMSDAAKRRNINEDNEKLRREKISTFMNENHPNSISVIDTRTNIQYKNMKDFCNKTNTSWYIMKKLQKNNLLVISNENKKN